MNKPYPNLNYEFYFLFKRDASLNIQIDWPLVTQQGGKLYLFRIDKDKLVFRWDAAAQTLEHWQEHLQQGWVTIRQLYPNSTACDQAFMGVALLILDETIASHRVTLPTATGETVTFQSAQDQIIADKVLLTVTDASTTFPMLQSVYLEEFVATPQESWQIQLNYTEPPRLAMLQDGEQFPNPAFAVYGLTHGIPDHQWADQLQTFLCSGKTSLLARVMPRLLMQKWQFQRLDKAAYQVRKTLDEKNQFYHHHEDDQLVCASDHRLEQTLSDMAKLEAAADQVMARLQSGIRTLEINGHNLERQLRHSKQIWDELEDSYPAADKHAWRLIWQGEDHAAPLLDQFELAQRKLQNHLAYLQSGLTYLEGIRKRWELQLEERQLEVGEKIGLLGHILILMVALGEVMKLTQEDGKPEHGEQITRCWQWLSDWWSCDTQTAWWQHASELLLGANTYVILLFFALVLPTGYYLTKFIWKKVKCLVTWLRHYFKQSDKEKCL